MIIIYRVVGFIARVNEFGLLKGFLSSHGGVDLQGVVDCTQRSLLVSFIISLVGRLGSLPRTS